MENHDESQDLVSFYWEEERWMAVETEDEILIRDEKGNFNDLSYDSGDEFLNDLKELMPGCYAGIEQGELEIYDRRDSNDSVITSDNYVGLEDAV